MEIFANFATEGTVYYDKVQLARSSSKWGGRYATPVSITRQQHHAYLRGLWARRNGLLVRKRSNRRPRIIRVKPTWATNTLAMAVPDYKERFGSHKADNRPSLTLEEEWECPEESDLSQGTADRSIPVAKDNRGKKRKCAATQGAAEESIPGVKNNCGKKRKGSATRGAVENILAAENNRGKKRKRTVTTQKATMKTVRRKKQNGKAGGGKKPCSEEKTSRVQPQDN